MIPSVLDDVALVILPQDGLQEARRKVLDLSAGPARAQLFEQLAMNEVNLWRFGWVGSTATRDRCLTVTTAWASPTTPRFSTISMA
jgi:hypothetical protein